MKTYYWINKKEINIYLENSELNRVWLGDSITSSLPRGLPFLRETKNISISYNSGVLFNAYHNHAKIKSKNDISVLLTDKARTKLANGRDVKISKGDVGFKIIPNNNFY